MVIETWNDLNFRFLSLPYSETWVLWIFEIKYSLAPKFVLLDLSFLPFGFLTKENCCRLFLLPLERFLCGAQGREKVEGILVPHMLLSQKSDLKDKQVINLDQDVHVCEHFLYGWCVDSFHELSLSLSLFLWTWAISLSLSLSLSFEYLDLHVSNSLSFFYIYFGPSCVQHSFFSSCFCHTRFF